MAKLDVSVGAGKKRVMPISAIGFTLTAESTDTGYATKCVIRKGITEYGVGNEDRNIIMGEHHAWRCRVWATIAEHEGQQTNDFEVVGKYRDVDTHIVEQVQDLLAELAADGMTVTAHGYTVKVIS